MAPFLIAFAFIALGFLLQAIAGVWSLSKHHEHRYRAVYAVLIVRERTELEGSLKMMMETIRAEDVIDGFYELGESQLFSPFARQDARRHFSDQVGQLRAVHPMFNENQPTARLLIVAGALPGLSIIPGTTPFAVLRTVMMTELDRKSILLKRWFPQPNEPPLPAEYAVEVFNSMLARSI